MIADAFIDTTVQTDTAGGTSASITLNITVGNHQNRLIKVKVAWFDVLVNGATISGITSGGTTLFQHDINSSPTNAMNVELWSSIAPALGSQTVTVTFTAAVSAVVSAESYYSVDQSSPNFGLGTSALSSGTTGTIRATVNGVNPGDMVTDIVVAERMLGADAITKQALQTQIMNQWTTHASGSVLAGSSWRQNTTPVNMQLSWTQSLTSIPWANIVSKIISNKSFQSTQVNQAIHRSNYF